MTQSKSPATGSQTRRAAGKPEADPGSMATPDQVITYLRMHPGFLAEHPQVLKAQRLHDQERGKDTASLLQRQNQLLRAQLDEQQQQLQQLASAARSNEQLLNRWHSLTLELMTSCDTVAFLDLLDARLRADFAADYVVLRLLDAQVDGSNLQQAKMVHAASGEHVPELQQLLQSRHAYCGRLIADKREAVFGEDRPASVALVAIAQLGLLAIGSDDPDRYVPGMGGLFIELLGKTVAWQLQRDVESYRKRA